MNWFKRLRVWLAGFMDLIMPDPRRGVIRSITTIRDDSVRDKYKIRLHENDLEHGEKIRSMRDRAKENSEQKKREYGRNDEDGVQPYNFGLGYMAGDIINDTPPQIDSSPGSNEQSWGGFGGGDSGGSGSSGSWDSGSSDSGSYDSGSSDSGSSDGGGSSD